MCAGILYRVGVLDNLDYFVDILFGDNQTLQYVGALFGFAKFEACAAGDYFVAVVDECLKQFFQIEGARTSVYNSYIVDRE